MIKIRNIYLKVIIDIYIYICLEDDHLKHNDRNEISEEKITYDKT